MAYHRLLLRDRSDALADPLALWRGPSMSP